MAPTRHAEVRAVGGAALVFGTLFLDRLAPLYLTVVLREELGLAAGELAAIPLAIGLGWAVAMAVGRWTGHRLPARTRIVVGAGGCAVLHLASALVDGWTAFVALRFLGGVLAGTVAPAITAVVFAWAPRQRRGLDAGITFSATRLLGSLVSPVLVLAVAVRVDWQASLVVSALLLLVATAAFRAVAPRDEPAPAATPPAGGRAVSRTVLAPHGRRNLAIATVLGCLLAGWLTIVSQLGPELVVSAMQVGPDRAGAVVGTFGIGGFLAALLVPALSDRLGRRVAVASSMTVGGVAGIVLALLLGGEDGVVWLAALLFGLGGVALGALPLALSVIPGEAVEAGDPGRAVAWPVVGAEVVGAAALPALAMLGYLPQRLSLAVAGVALTVGAVLALALVAPGTVSASGRAGTARSPGTRSPARRRG